MYTITGVKNGVSTLHVESDTSASGALNRCRAMQLLHGAAIVHDAAGAEISELELSKRVQQEG
ncbi:MAG: hypothetical protein Tsb0016_22430 [Sphingomonadales bacterium]